MSKQAHRGSARTDPWLNRAMLTTEFERPKRKRGRALTVIGCSLLALAVGVGGSLLGMALFVAPPVGNGPAGTGTASTVPAGTASSSAGAGNGSGLTPVQVYMRDVGMVDTAANERTLLHTVIPMECNLFASGLPLEDPTPGSNARIVQGLNDSHLCGSAPVTLPPTAWPTIGVG